MEQTKFEVWALVELMGHQRIAGRVTEQVIAGHGFLRITVPETKSNPQFDRFVSPNSVYAINPITEDVARAYADSLSVKPIVSWDIQDFLQKASQQLTAHDPD